MGCSGDVCGDEHGTRSRRGLDVLKSYLGGVFVSFGSPNTPVNQGNTRRFSADGLTENNVFLWPFQEMPTITNPTHYREASPTGKVAGGELFARLPEQDFTGPEANARLTLLARPVPDGARKITRAQVDPWGSTVGKVSWTPGEMAREAVSG